MVCGRHFKIKYVRFLIKYHLFIFFCTIIMTSLCVIILMYKRDQIQFDHLLRGFQAHGTKSSDAYRKLIALMRETQTRHLFPQSANGKTPRQIPYPSFNPHINPCSKRFYMSGCPILNYTELIFTLNGNHTTLFDEIDTFKSICKLEWGLRARFTNCSAESTYTCCQFIGPVDILLGGQLTSVDQCENYTSNQLHEFHQRWSSCTSSSCTDLRLQTYLKHIRSPITFNFYLSVNNDDDIKIKTKQLLEIYDHFHIYDQTLFHLIHLNFGQNDEELVFTHLLKRHIPFVCISIGFYFLCLLLFVKNIFFIFIILVHILLTCLCSLFIYTFLFHFPIIILNYTSITLYLFITLIDSFLWYACWFVNNHRRDDCTIQRIIENLLTQTFYYLVPKNLTAIIALVITYTNQIIALQYFTIFSFLLLSISFFVSFTLYPASFIFILRYQASIPTIEHLSHRILTTTTNCFIERTIPCLIVRLKGVWLALLTIVACLALIIIFQWPKLEFDVCQMTFDALPLRLSSSRIINHINRKQIAKTTTTTTIDIDVTYYIGSHLDVPIESMIPLRDYPLLNYFDDDKLTSMSNSAHQFAHVLETNLSYLIDFCAQFTSNLRRERREIAIDRSDARRSHFKHFHRHIVSLLPTFDNQTVHKTSTQEGTRLSPNGNSPLVIANMQCFGDLSPAISKSSFFPLTNRFSSIIVNRTNHSLDCNSICSPNMTDNRLACLTCLIASFNFRHVSNDLFLLKNGLRFINDPQNSKYLLQTITYQWTTWNLNHFSEWSILMNKLRLNSIWKFYSNTFDKMSLWWSSELFATFSIMEQLQQEKHLLIAIKFVVVLIFLSLFTGVLGIFVTLTTLFNFATCIAILTLFHYKLTIENMAYFVIVLIVCSQYSVLYSISYKLAPTFFFQRENRTMYSLKQLCTTLFHLTLSIILICTSCFTSSLPYLSKSATVYMISSVVSLIYSTFFLQSLLCFLGPAEHSCFLLPWRLTFRRKSQMANSADISLRGSTAGTRRHHRHLSHHRMSTSSHFPSSYFSQIFTGSTYFESEYGGVNENLPMGSRRRESSRSHQTVHGFKRSSLLTGELIELYSPRASLAPYNHHLYHHRYSRQSSIPRGVTIAPARPLYISPSISPYSQLSIHSQLAPRQRSPSPQILLPSRSPSPRSFAPATFTSSTGSLRPCYSAPRLHVPFHRVPTNSLNINIKPTDILLEETIQSRPHTTKKTVMIIQRQDAISSTDDVQFSPAIPSGVQLSAATRRSMLKTTTTESGGPVWLKRSNSS